MARKRCKLYKCPLYKGREVPYAGNKKARIALVGESPGWEEEMDGRPFIGDSGKLAHRLVKTARLIWADLFIMNSARCRIDKSSMTNKQITATLACCRKYVVEALTLLKPSVIICCGDVALRQILRRSGIKKHHGKWVWSEEFNAWVMPTYHPAYILRNKALEPWLLKDLDKVKEFADNDYTPLAAESVHYGEIQSISHFLDRMDEKDAKVVMAGFDTESQGLDWVSPNFLMLSYQLSIGKKKAVMVRFYEEAMPKDADFIIQWPRVLPWNKKKEAGDVGIRRLPNFNQKVVELERLLAHPKIKKYMVNGNFDLHVLDAFFWREKACRPKIVGYAMDLQAGAQLLEENIFQQASLSDLQFHFTNMKVDYNAEFERKYDKADMLAVPVDAFVAYGCADADSTRRAAVGLKGCLVGAFPDSKDNGNKKLARYMVKFVMPTLTKCLLEMERNGVWLDQKALPGTMADVDKTLKEHQAAALKVIPTRVAEKEDHVKKGLKLTRSALLSDTLFSKEGFGIKPWKKTKGGDAWSTDKEVRRRLLEQRIPKRAVTFIKEFDEWQELYTLWSRYLKGFEKHVRSDARIHTSLSIAKAVTGRVSSVSPNLMNNPKRSKSAYLIRRLLAAPPGWLLLAADEAQSELRWAADLADEKKMKWVFAKGLDIHTETAKELIRRGGGNWNQLGKKEQEKARRDAKPVNFGLLYMMSAWGFVRYCFMEYGLTINEDQARQYIDAFFGMYPGLRTYHRKTISFCRTHGYVESVLGRRRRLPEITSKNDRARAAAERQCVDKETECLTKFGWKRYDKLKKGNLIWARNWNSGKLQLEPILKVNVYPDYRGEAVSWDRPGFNAVTTPKHRWLVDTLNRRTGKRAVRFCASDILKTGPYMRIIKAVPSSIPDGPIPNALLKATGWILTDGGYNSSSETTVIYQSEKKYADEVRTLLSQFGEVRQRLNHRVGQLVFTVPLPVSRFVRKHFPEKILTAAFVSGLSERQAKVLMEAMLDGDGCRESQGTVFCAATKKAADAFQYLCTMAGIATTAREVGQRSNTLVYQSIGYKIQSKPCWLVWLCRLNTVHSQYGRVALKNFKGLVWCPTVKSGNFVARRNGVTYLTGNSVNHRIQSPSSDVVLMAGNEIVDANLNPEEFKLSLFIHDELVSLVREDADVEMYGRLVKEAMENPPLKRDFGYQMSVPLVADVKVGPNLAEMRDLEL